MQVVIIAGGKGTRLQSITADLPKPMVDVGGKPLLEHQVVLARKHGIRDILMLTGFGSGQIEKYFGDGARWDTKISYHREEHPLGTGGALLDAIEKLDDVFLVMYGDTMINVDLGRMLKAHSGGCAATLFLHPNDHPFDSDLVELNAADEVTALHPYPHPPGSCFPNLVNAALYVFSRPALTSWPEEAMGKPLDICKHMFPQILAAGGKLRGYRSREYIKDAGTPERLEKVRGHYATGRVQRGSYETPAPAVFFDRDGTLNVEDGWISSPEQIRLLPGAAEAIKAVNDSGRLAVIVTNQPVVARGECTEEGLRKVHNRLEWLLGEAHAYVDAIYYCPHHPDGGFAGERCDLKFACACRKPAAGLLRKAADDLKIDIEKSWMIGDSDRDISAGVAFGIPVALVRANQEMFNSPGRNEPEFRAASVVDAVHQILGRGLRQE